MKNNVLSHIGIAILLNEFCSNCPMKDNCINYRSCRVVEFAEYLIDKGFEKEYLLNSWLS